MNSKQDWRAKLESAYSLVVHYCKNTVCDKLTENTSNAPNLSAEFVCPTVWDFDEKKGFIAHPWSVIRCIFKVVP